MRMNQPQPGNCTCECKRCTPGELVIGTPHCERAGRGCLVNVRPPQTVLPPLPVPAYEPRPEPSEGWWWWGEDVEGELPF